jgi:predicted alpha/beta hydrolase
MAALPDASDAALRETLLRIGSSDGASADLQFVSPAQTAHDVLLWLPALGVAARNYLPLAHALAARGVVVALHEWRGGGSSDRRASRAVDWGYRQLLADDIPASLAALRRAYPTARLWLGGHSLGGQFAALTAALATELPAGLVLVASGSPYWRKFRHAWLIRAFYTFVPLVAAICGYFPGRRLGFGGREARGVMSDWARSGRSGRYAAAGMPQDMEAALARLRVPVFAWRLEDDWLGPARSLDWLLQKMPGAPSETGLICSSDLAGARADHFSWMKSPSTIAARIAEKMLS